MQRSRTRKNLCSRAEQRGAFRAHKTLYKWKDFEEKDSPRTKVSKEESGIILLTGNSENPNFPSVCLYQLMRNSPHPKLPPSYFWSSRACLTCVGEQVTGPAGTTAVNLHGPAHPTSPTASWAS